MEDLKRLVRDVPDFPKKGIIFKDITPLIADPKAYQKAINAFAKRYDNKGIDKIVSVEARGFLFGAPLAYGLGAGIVPVRKPGKLPFHTNRISYELEYGTDSLDIHKDSIKKGEKILIVDDLLATGGTVAAVCKLVEQLEGKIIELAFLIELGFLKGRDKLKGYSVFSLIRF
ncbi:MAG: adenine phosphoribosyltransferase [Candidatus Schekmanbacteria bacterium RBG_16_38_11]|uniref:Adenine phosphoribosyltransferase n=1 Tax=Candidatus Schekmanbacteria bacterium RBG_16_38_11 TaxID=1817880 RepID=A0A1F7S160_9BACT|nr:MAG: adenine phosphoribosyltransferase [Candidatus Schekmanbacteria bacterium RBG_16_38_11]